MPCRNILAIVVLTGSALLMTGASAQQPAPQATQPADGQTSRALLEATRRTRVTD